MSNHPILLINDQKIDVDRLIASAQMTDGSGMSQINAFFQSVLGAAYREGAFSIASFVGDDAALQTQVAGLIYTVIDTVLCNPANQISRGLTLELCMAKNFLSDVFMACDTGSSQLLHQRVDALATQLEQTQRQYRHLIALTLYSGPYGLDLKNIFAEDVGLGTAVTFGLLLSRNQFTPEAEAYFLNLAEVIPLLTVEGFKSIRYEDAVFGLYVPWMACSYCVDVVGKMAFKKAINQYYLRCIEYYKIKTKGINLNSKSGGKPKLIVAAELLYSTHAMYRCYARAFTALRSYFDVVLVCADAKTIDDPEVQTCFEHKIISLVGKSVPDCIQALVQAKPDIIFYPSVGMSEWAPVASQIRIAPIQTMSVGHPESSFSAQMDYVLSGDALFTKLLKGEARSLHSEHIIGITSDPFFMPLTLWGSQFEKQVAVSKEGVINIAILGGYLKVSYAMLMVLKAIEEKCSVPLCFHFYSGSQGMELAAFKKVIDSVFKNAVVYGNLDYSDYMQGIADCDLAIGSFPFGNANAIVDSILAKTPQFFIDDIQAASRTDELMRQAYNLPDALRCQGAEALIETVIHHAENADALAALCASLAIAWKTAVEPDLSNTDLVAKTMQWIYQNHQTLQEQKPEGRYTQLTEAILRDAFPDA